MKQTNEKRNYIIYMYTFPNGKRYIGKTSNTLKRRQADEDWTGYEECPAVFNAINKYKPENIQQDILAEGFMTKSESSEIERYYIALYKTNCNRYHNPEYGYNLTDGGDDSCGPRPNICGDNHPNAKPVYYIETNQYYGSALSAQEATGFNKEGIGACCRGEYFVTHHPDDYTLISHWLFASDVTEDNIKRVLTGPQPKSTEKMVYCIELDKYFQNSCEAERELGVDAFSVRACCRGEFISTGYYSSNASELHWLWAEEVTKENIANALNRKHIPSNAQRVYCIEADVYFNTEKDGAKYAGVCDIKKSLNNYGYAGGKHPVTKEPLHWLRAEEVNEENILQVLSIANNLKADALQRFKNKVDGTKTGANNPRAKFTEDDVKEIIRRLLCGEKSADIARDYNRPLCAISDIKNHRAWTYLTKDIVFTKSI